LAKNGEITVTEHYLLYQKLLIGVDEKIENLTNSLIYNAVKHESVQYMRGEIIGLEYAKKVLKEALNA